MCGNIYNVCTKGRGKNGSSHHVFSVRNFRVGSPVRFQQSPIPWTYPASSSIIDCGAGQHSVSSSTVDLNQTQTDSSKGTS